MGLLHPPSYCSSTFTVGPDGVLVAEESDLRAGLGPVYDDACDEGLMVVSRRTGAEVVFAVDRVERDREGDVLYTDLVSVTPGHKGHRLRLFND